MLSLLVTALFAFAFLVSAATIAATWRQYQSGWSALAAEAGRARHRGPFVTVSARPAQPAMVYARQLRSSAGSLQPVRRAAA